MRGLVLVSVLGSGCFFKPEAPGANVDDGGTLIDDGSSSTSDSYLGANYMFVTSEAFVANTLTSATVVDDLCKTAADKVGLPGTFVAWWSTEASLPITHARDRLGNARGWIRPDGLPFADTVDELANGIIYTPPRISETGSDVWNDQPTPVYTGTDATGLASGRDCAVTADVTVGVVDATQQHWTNTGNRPLCDVSARLYCFGTDNAVEVTPPPLAPSHKVAFVTSVNVPVNAGGVSTLHSACNNMGQTLRPGATFTAFVASSGSSALSKLPANSAGWYRPDGIKLVDDSGFTSFRVPLNVTELTTYNAATAYAGAPDMSTQADPTTSCDFWTDGGNTPKYTAGQIHHSERLAWDSIGSLTCLASSRVYCFQTN